MLDDTDLIELDQKKLFSSTDTAKPEMSVSSVA